MKGRWRIGVFLLALATGCGPSASERERQRVAEVELQRLEAECARATAVSSDMVQLMGEAAARGDDGVRVGLERANALLVIEHSRCFIDEVVDEARAIIEAVLVGGSGS